MREGRRRSCFQYTSRGDDFPDYRSPFLVELLIQRHRQHFEGVGGREVRGGDSCAALDDLVLKDRIHTTKVYQIDRLAELLFQLEAAGAEGETAMGLGTRHEEEQGDIYVASLSFILGSMASEQVGRLRLGIISENGTEDILGARHGSSIIA
jgi:hypothetical protein